MLLWPGLPQNPGLDRAYQAFPGHVFLASPAKSMASRARLGRACHAFDPAPDAREDVTSKEHLVHLVIALS